MFVSLAALVADMTLVFPMLILRPMRIHQEFLAVVRGCVLRVNHQHTVNRIYTLFGFL